jgi:hypothetical protein
MQATADYLYPPGGGQDVDSRHVIEQARGIQADAAASVSWSGISAVGAGLHRYRNTQLRSQVVAAVALMQHQATLYMYLLHRTMAAG